ncbi:hypothetical protein B0O99DRAFT_626225 [Bisporella sp. PMI_857]|nr:hypothetical protein B0O99DRAFT_626225 [Bisporella sp. PMI_857]
MKLSTASLVALSYSACCAALGEIKELERKSIDNREAAKKDNTGTCSIGIGREMNSINWDITVYNVPQLQRQDVNIIATLKHVPMPKGGSVTVPSPAKAITITNVDNAPVFTYDEPVIKAPFLDPKTGVTNVELKFEIKDGNVTWTSDDCGPVNVAFTGGREGYSCDFPCTVSLEREL